MLESKFNKYDTVLDSNWSQILYMTKGQLYEQLVDQLSYYILGFLYSQYQYL
jgi:hypothetical protein